MLLLRRNISKKKTNNKQNSFKLNRNKVVLASEVRTLNLSINYLLFNRIESVFDHFHFRFLDIFLWKPAKIDGYSFEMLNWFHKCEFNVFSKHCFGQTENFIFFFQTRLFELLHRLIKITFDQ